MRSTMMDTPLLVTQLLRSMGAVLHTLNIRLFPDLLAFVIEHAGDKVIVVDDSLVPALARVRDPVARVERFLPVELCER